MLKFPPESIAALGEAAMLLDGDTVYIYATNWMFVVTNADYHIPADVMDLLQEREDGYLIDWRILSASVLSSEEKKFIPWKGHRHAPIELCGWRWSSVSVDACKDRAERSAESVWGEVYDLSALFGRGEADPEYATAVKNKEETFAKVSMAVSYTFRFHDRALRLSADYFDALSEMGFQISAPANNIQDNYMYQPLAGLYMPEEPEVFGFLVPETETRITESADGRSLLVDASHVCWGDEEWALALMATTESYPIEYGDRSASGMVLDGCNETLCLAVGWMRWSGWDEDEINEIYAAGREAAYHIRLRDLDFVLDQLTHSLKEGHTLTTWQIDKANNDLESLQMESEMLCEWLGLDVDFLAFQNLRRLLADIEDEVA